MERIRYFRSANRLNVVTNFLSGNLFPLSSEKDSLGVLPLAWITFVWIVKVTYFLTVLSGGLYFANLTPEEAFKKSGAANAVFFELIVPSVYLNLRRKDLRGLIRKYNVVLIDSEELKKIVSDTIEPYRKGLQFYVIVCLVTASSWSAAPITIVFSGDQFTYADYAAPAYLPGEPFGTKAFVAGVILQIFGASFISFGKISIDIYISHFIAVLSAEYKYVRSQISDVLSEENDGKDETSIIRALRNCVRHHCAVIEIGRRLADILALYIGMTYITCIMKLCFLAFGVITFETENIEKASYFVYALACTFQIFLLCSCIQELLDVVIPLKSYNNQNNAMCQVRKYGLHGIHASRIQSSSVTCDAFHKNWHARSNAVKKFFGIIQLSNQMECRLSAYRVIDLIVPSLAVILSKSYSVCLLLLEVN